MAPYRMIQVGTGGFGEHWCRVFLPPNIAAGLIEVVAAVDIDPAALKTAQQHLGLRPDQCYTSSAQAFDAHRADFCTIVVPPQFHESVVDLALAHDMHILSEKPIADTLPASIRIANKVRRAGKKMGVTMTHRFDQDKRTLREEVRSGRHGPLDYLVCRLITNSRRYGVLGTFRHQMDYPLLVDGAVHHLDLLADMAGAECEVLYAESWKPAWAEYAGDTQALVTMRFRNGTRASYEGAYANAAGLSEWRREYIRAECKLATLILDHRRLERFDFQPAEQRTSTRHGEGIPVPLLERPNWSNTWLVEQFVRWLEGGPPMETNVEANLQSVALVAAAIESKQTGQPVRVQELLARARKELERDEAPGV